MKLLAFLIAIQDGELSASVPAASVSSGLDGCSKLKPILAEH
jgi:hypothetical protein